MTHFRPRPIDIHKALPIIRKEIESDSFANLSRTVPNFGTGMEAEEEKEKHLQEVLSSQNLGEKEGAEIPTPGVKIVKDYDSIPLKPFTRPPTYIHHRDDIPEIVNYDLDSEDESIVNQANEKFYESKKVLTFDKFESLIDRFEKETYDNEGKIPPFSAVERLVATGKLTSNVVQFIYDYWIERRKSGHFSGHYIKVPEPDDPSPWVAFRPRLEEKMKKKSRKNDQQSFFKMRHLRQEMERARTLLEMIKKREKIKRDIILVTLQLLEFQCLDVKYSEIPMANPFRNPPKPIFAKRNFQSLEFTPSNEYQEFFEDSESESDESSSIEFSGSEEESDTDYPAMKRLKLLNGIGTLPGVNGQRNETIRGLDPNIPSFRGRGRIGRGGRIIFDRRPSPQYSGIIPQFETDAEFFNRTESLAALYKTGDHPFSCRTDAESLLKKLQSVTAKRIKLAEKQKSIENSEMG